MTTTTTTIVPEGITFNAIDCPVKATDVQFDEDFGSESAALPSSYFMQYAYISNQGSTPDCTAHSQAGASNENNGLEASKLNALQDARLIDPVGLGEFGHKVGAILSTGGFINWAFKYLIEWGYISGYSVVLKNETSIKNAIMRNGALVTGSNKITWSEFKPGWVAVHRENSPGHAFRIDGWDDSKGAFRIANSWSEAWGDAGFFWVKYEDINLLFTVYAFHDANDKPRILRAKAKKLGMWNGDRPDDVATRREALLIGSRIVGKIGTDYDILAIAKLQKVYDGTREDDKVTLFEAKTIFTRLGVKNSPTGITRGNLAECI